MTPKMHDLSTDPTKRSQSSAREQAIPQSSWGQVAGRRKAGEFPPLEGSEKEHPQEPVITWHRQLPLPELAETVLKVKIRHNNNNPYNCVRPSQ